MKDLYRNLDIDPGASAEELAAALQNRPDLSEYAPVLLDEKKRAGYDRTHAILKTIGVLRHKLSLDSGDSWFLENYPDFAPKNIQGNLSPSFRKPEPKELQPESMQLSKTPVRSNQSVYIILGVVLAALIILAYPFL